MFSTFFIIPDKCTNDNSRSHTVYINSRKKSVVWINHFYKSLDTSSNIPISNNISFHILELRDLSLGYHLPFRQHRKTIIGSNNCHNSFQKQKLVFKEKLRSILSITFCLSERNVESSICSKRLNKLSN